MGSRCALLSVLFLGVMTTHFSAGLTIYKDVISGDEMFSDKYKIKTIKDIFYEVEGKVVVSFESPVGRSVDIVLDHDLQQTYFTKDQYITYIKEYGKDIKTYLTVQGRDDRAAIFSRGFEDGVKGILGHFKDWEFFTGESKNSEGMVALLNYRSDGVTPYMLFIKDGLEEEKAY